MTIAEQASGERTTCQIEVQLMNGERIDVRVDGDRESARTALAEVHSRLDAQRFVLVGEDTVVRSEDVRFVRLRDDDESGGILDAFRSKLGGDGMSNYETQERQREGATQRGEQGFADQWVGYGNRPWAETKPFFMTSEFLGAVILIAGILIATGMNDNLDAPRGWLYAAVVGAAYILSRGFAKSGTRDPNPDRGWRGRNQG